MKKLCISTIAATMIFPLSNIAYADSYQSNDPLTSNHGRDNALEKAKELTDHKIKASKVNNFDDANSTAIGRLKNLKRHSSGTAVAIDKHTLLTNNHVIEAHKTSAGNRNYKSSKPHELSFNALETSEDSSHSFEIDDTHMIKNADIAIVHTKEDLTKQGIVPMQLENERTIKDMKAGDLTHSFGYPDTKYFKNTKFETLSKLKNPTQIKAEGHYLGTSKHTSEEHMFVQEPLKRGNSGSPIINENNKIVGIFPNGFNDQTSNTAYGKEYICYAVSLVGNIRDEIQKEMR